MILVYPVSITCLYGLVLYVNRENIKNKDIPKDDSLKDEIPPSTSWIERTSSNVSKRLSFSTLFEIEFLHKAYKGNCWGWEVVETVRRLLLTAVISVVSTGEKFNPSVSIISRLGSTVLLGDSLTYMTYR
jgi:hypothetical protein